MDTGLKKKMHSKQGGRMEDEGSSQVVGETQIDSRLIGYLIGTVAQVISR